MFSRISHRYDLLNRLMTGGLDQSWRRRAVETLPAAPTGGRYLDLATGTADLALAIAERFDQSVCIHGVDLSWGMLTVARDKTQRISLQAADIEHLPFADNSFHGATIGFGIRNVVDRLQGAREIRRVLQPNGVLVILEALPAERLWQRCLQRLHMLVTVRVLGTLLSESAAYRYLGDSVAAFPKASEFQTLLLQAGFSEVRFEALTAGAVGLFICRK